MSEIKELENELQQINGKLKGILVKLEERGISPKLPDPLRKELVETVQLIEQEEAAEIKAEGATLKNLKGIEEHEKKKIELVNEFVKNLKEAEDEVIRLYSDKRSSRYTSYSLEWGTNQLIELDTFHPMLDCKSIPSVAQRAIDNWEKMIKKFLAVCLNVQKFEYNFEQLENTKLQRVYRYLFDKSEDLRWDTIKKRFVKEDVMSGEKEYFWEGKELFDEKRLIESIAESLKIFIVNLNKHFDAGVTGKVSEVNKLLGDPVTAWNHAVRRFVSGGECLKENTRGDPKELIEKLKKMYGTLEQILDTIVKEERELGISKGQYKRYKKEVIATSVKAGELEKEAKRQMHELLNENTVPKEVAYEFFKKCLDIDYLRTLIQGGLDVKFLAMVMAMEL